MVRRIEDFAVDWQDERTGTAKLFRLITDASLGQAIEPGGRTLGFLAWHICQSHAEIMGHCGLEIDAPAGDAPVPASAAEIVAAYDRGSASVLETVTTHWSDDMLEDPVAAYGHTFQRGQMLDMLIRHEAHHRGQIIVLMRQAGLPVTGPYGPSREDWAALGMEALP